MLHLKKGPVELEAFDSCLKKLFLKLEQRGSKINRMANAVGIGWGALAFPVFDGRKPDVLFEKLAEGGLVGEIEVVSHLLDGCPGSFQ